MTTPASRDGEATTLRILKWTSLGSLVLAIASFVLNLPGGDVVAPWLMVIAVGTYVAFAVIDIRRRRRIKRVTP